MSPDPIFILKREQQIVVQRNYNRITDLWLRQPPQLANWLVGGVTVPVNASGLANAGEWLSANANKNPIPGGPAFRAVVPGGRLDTYNDRWAWTSNATNGMIERWTGASSAGPNFDAATRMQRNDLPMRTAAGFSSPVYSFDPDYLPTE